MPSVQVVADQIRLWQQERARLSATDCWLYRNFESEQLYSRVAAFAERMGQAVWKDDTRQCLAVPNDFKERIKAYITEQKNILHL